MVVAERWSGYLCTSFFPCAPRRFGCQVPTFLNYTFVFGDIQSVTGWVLYVPQRTPRSHNPSKGKGAKHRLSQDIGFFCFKYAKTS